MSQEKPLGASLRDDGVEVRVWAPKARRLTLVMDGREVPMASEGRGTFAAVAPGRAGSRYGLRIDGGRPFPDPCSRSQPDGVHGLSEVIDAGAFAWTDSAWMSQREPPVALERVVLYELHVGTFTPAGTFAAAAAKLGYLRDLGVTAVELMPLHAFPGRFNWGYDPGAFFAVPPVYGGHDDLRRLVDRAHALGLAVLVDVVLNHLGPDGAYVNAYAPMLTPASTPWGSAVNLADDGVRRFLREAALVWLTEYHVDGLRLDATSRLRDRKVPHFLAELTAAAERLPGPRRLLIAEDLRNHATVTERREQGGQGLDSQWVDDLASMARHLAGDHQPYYGEYADASARTLATALLDGWWMTGRVAHHADTLEASTPTGPLVRVTHYLDNHDQAGNRPRGEPFAALCPPPLARALTAVLLFAPHVPLLWMGQEWGSTVPFWFFADHGGGLGASVRRGRQKDHESWWRPAPPAPDPTSAATFAAARLDWDAAHAPAGAAWTALVRRLLLLRSSLPTDPAGAWHVEAPDDSTLRLDRGGRTMLVALRPGVSLPDPGGAEELVTEAPPFALDGRPPVRRDGRVHFAQPAALVLGRSLGSPGELCERRGGGAEGARAPQPPAGGG